MPQMMPINWLILMLLFIIIFLLFNIMNYFCIKINNNNYKMKINKKNENSLNWKW